jgi:aminotransferase
MTTKTRPDIRIITRLVPPSGNLVQGQSELTISPALASAAAKFIAASMNHYSPAEGDAALLRSVAENIRRMGGAETESPSAAASAQLLISHGATGALVAIARTYLKDACALVFEPYYPYHRRIVEECGGKTEVLSLRGEQLEIDPEELRARCRELKERDEYPLRAIIACTPANPTGKVFARGELELIAEVCHELDLLCIADEVYEHFVERSRQHLSIAHLPGMWERTVTANSFSKSWNISGWRLGYVYGSARLIAPLKNTLNVFYVCSPTPLQRALAEALVSETDHYDRLRENFEAKRSYVTRALKEVGFRIYDSGSMFYIWARIPEGYAADASELNDRLIKEAGVGAVPGSAFADGDEWDNHMRLCIAREDEMLHGAVDKLHSFFQKSLNAKSAK